MTSEERRELRYQRRKAKRDAARLARSQACGDFEEVFSFRHLYLSGKKCCKGVLWKHSTQHFIAHIIVVVAVIHRDLMAGTFKHRGFHEFDLIERGKKRHIRAVHITERTVQKCLCDYCIVPIFSASFIYDNSASLKHRGMDFALRRMICHLEQHFRKYGWEGGILLFDFHNYFDDAAHGPLFAESERRIHDERTRELANSFVEDFGPVGLGLGSQVSQTNALLLPSPLDHFFKEVCGIGGYGRYMDDGYAIHPDIEYLYLCKDGMEMVCQEQEITLNQKKTKIIPLIDFYRFLKTKFVLTNSGKIVLKMNRASTRTIRHKLVSFQEWHEAGAFTLEDLRCAYDSYRGHMRRGNSFKVLSGTDHYFKSLFGFYPNKKGWERHVQNSQRYFYYGGYHISGVGEKAG